VNEFKHHIAEQKRVLTLLNATYSLAIGQRFCVRNSNGFLVGRQGAGNDVHISAHAFTDMLSTRAGLCILRMEESLVAIALADADNDFFRCFWLFLPSWRD